MCADEILEGDEFNLALKYHSSVPYKIDPKTLVITLYLCMLLSLLQAVARTIQRIVMVLRGGSYRRECEEGVISGRSARL